MRKGRGFFGDDDFVRVKIDGLIRADINLTALIKRLFDRHLPEDVDPKSFLARYLRHRMRSVLMRGDVLVNQLALALLEASEIAVLVAELTDEREQNVKIIEGGPTALALDVTNRRRSVLAREFAALGAGKKRPRIAWQAWRRPFVEEVDALLPRWKEAHRFFRENTTLDGLTTTSSGTDEALPTDLLNDLARRQPTRDASAPLALACEHAARRLGIDREVIEAGGSYTRLTLRNIYQRAKSAIGDPRRRGRPRKNNLLD